MMIHPYNARFSTMDVKAKLEALSAGIALHINDKSILPRSLYESMNVLFSYETIDETTHNTQR